MTDTLKMAREALASCNSNDGDDPWYDAEKVRAAIAAIDAQQDAPAAPAVPQWKPIETAPDGVMLLFADMQASEARHWVFCGWRYSGLRGNSVQMPDNTARSATHWRYLPAAPSAPGAEGGE